MTGDTASLQDTREKLTCWERRGVPPLAPRGLGGAIPWERMLLRAGAWARLQLPVLTLARPLAAWPVPAKGALCGEGAEVEASVAGPLSARTGWAPGVCRAGLKHKCPPQIPQARRWRCPGWHFLPADLGPIYLTMLTGVPSETRRTGAGPPDRVTGSSILTPALHGTVLPEGAVAASWHGERGVISKSNPASPR